MRLKEFFGVIGAERTAYQSSAQCLGGDGLMAGLPLANWASGPALGGVVGPLMGEHRRVERKTQTPVMGPVCHILRTLLLAGDDIPDVLPLVSYNQSFHGTFHLREYLSSR